MPPARLALTAREPHLSAPVAKDAYNVGSPLASIAGSGLYTAFSPMANHSGVSVTPFTAMQSAVVYSCIRCLSEDMAKLPILISKAIMGGGWDVDHFHPISKLFRRPNRWQTCFTFIAYVVTCLQLRGNAYIFVVRDGNGAPSALIPIGPDRCTMRLSPQGWLYYDIWHPAFGSRGNLTVHQDDMLHLKNVSLNGFVGLSTITAAAEAIGLSLATQQHGANLFRQGTQASGVLEHPQTLTEAARNNLRESWQERYSGVDNSHKVLLLEEGMKFAKLSMTSDEAQFLETRKFQAEDIARIFRVPQHKVGILDHATFSNIENQNQSYIDDSLIPMAKQLEEESEHKLFWESERPCMRLRVDFDSMLRGDMKTRYEAYHLGLGDGWLNRDGVRSREGLPPIPDGAGREYRVALNTGPASAAAAPKTSI